MRIKRNIVRSITLAAGLMAAVAFTMPFANASLQWQDVRSSVAIRGLATNGSIYIATADNGIFTSNDLTNWSRVTLPADASQSYNDVIWSAAGNEFVAVGLGTILTSPDGSTWTASYTAASGLGTSLKSVIHANGTYVVVGTDNNGAITLLSTNGSSWQLNAVPNPTSHTLEFDGITWGNGLYVAMGTSFLLSSNGQIIGGSDALYTSPDAVSWTAQSLPSGHAFDNFGGNDAAFANNTFVVGGSFGVYSSSDGVNWTSEPLPSSTSNDSWFFGRIQNINGGFLAVGVDYGNTNYSGQELAVFTSPDGSNWSMIPLNQTVRQLFTSTLDAITPGGPGYVIGGDAGIATSANESTWSFQASNPEPIYVNCVYYDHGVMAARGANNSITSSDGIHWSAPTANQNSFFISGQSCMAGNGTLFVSSNYPPDYSSDGLNWTDATGPLINLHGVAYENGNFYSIGINGFNQPELIDSSDGKTWYTITETGLPTDGSFEAYTGAFIAAGGNLITWGTHTNGGQPFMATSGNGSQWSVLSGLPSALASIAAVGYGNGTYIAIGYDASGNTLMLNSTDAHTWTQVSILPAGIQGAQWGNISYGGSMWLITGTSGSIPGMTVAMTSSDGQNWTLQNLGVGNLGIPNGTWAGNGFLIATNDDILFVPVSTNSGGGSGGGGSSGGGTSSAGSSGGGGGSLGFLSLALLGLIAGICRRRRWCQSPI